MRRSRRPARRNVLRMLLLAIALILANSLSPWTSSAHAQTRATQQAGKHCHEKPAPTAHEHGSACPCCNHGCLCLHANAAPLPQFLLLPALAPVGEVASFARTTSPEPPTAERLRPPIA